MGVTSVDFDSFCFRTSFLLFAENQNFDNITLHLETINLLKIFFQIKKGNLLTKASKAKNYDRLFWGDFGKSFGVKTFVKPVFGKT